MINRPIDALPLSTSAAVERLGRRPARVDAPTRTRLRGSRSERTPPNNERGGLDRLAHPEDDAEVGDGAEIEDRERERDTCQAVADRRDRRGAEEQAVIALGEGTEGGHGQRGWTAPRHFTIAGSVGADAVRRSRLLRRHLTAIDRSQEIGCDAVQVFTQSPRMWRPTNHTPEAVTRFRERREEAGSAASSATPSTSSTSPRRIR